MLSPDYAAAQFLLLDTCSVMPLCLPADEDRCDESRAMVASTPWETVQPSAMDELDQPLCLLGSTVEAPATGIHGDEECLYGIDVPEGVNAFRVLDRELELPVPPTRPIACRGSSRSWGWGGPSRPAYLGRHPDADGVESRCSVLKLNPSFSGNYIHTATEDRSWFVRVCSSFSG